MDKTEKIKFKPFEEIKKEYEKEQKMKEEKEQQEKEWIASQPF